MKLNTSDNKNKAIKKRAGKSKQTKRAALLAGIPPANINLFAKIEELVGFLENNK